MQDKLPCESRGFIGDCLDRFKDFLFNVGNSIDDYIGCLFGVVILFLISALWVIFIMGLNSARSPERKTDYTVIVYKNDEVLGEYSVNGEIHRSEYTESYYFTDKNGRRHEFFGEQISIIEKEK